MPKAENILESLFVSRVRIKVLKYLLLHTKTSIHMRGLVREIEEEINAVRRELLRLEEMGVVTSEETGGKKLFQINEESIFYFDLLSIFHKTFGLGKSVIDLCSQMGGVKFALLTEDYLKQVHVGPQKIDLVVIGEADLNELGKTVENTEKILGIEIFYTVMSEREFLLKKKRRDPFVTQMLLKRHVLLIGNFNELIS